MTAESLRVERLRKTFDGIVAIDDVSTEIRAGEVTAIIGPNGAGKSTFVNLISGVLSPTSGQIYLRDRDVTSLPPQSRVSLGLARSFQYPQLYETLTTFDNVKSAIVVNEGLTSNLTRPLSAYPEVADRVDELLASFGLEDYRDIAAENLSHGVRKILDIAITFTLDPFIVVLDEPTSGVSSEQKFELMDEVMQMRAVDDAGLVIIEHDMDIVAEYSDRIIVLADGRIIESGAPADVMNMPSVEEHVV